MHAHLTRLLPARTPAGQEEYRGGGGGDGGSASQRFLPAAEIASEFYSNTAPGRAATLDLSVPFAAEGPAGVDPLPAVHYGAPALAQARACLSRAWQLQRGQAPLIWGRILSNLVLGLCVGTLFLDTPTGYDPADGGLQVALTSAASLIGVCFFSVENA